LASKATWASKPTLAAKAPANSAETSASRIASGSTAAPGPAACLATQVLGRGASGARSASRLHGVGDALPGFGFELGVECGTLGDIRRIDNPPRHGKRHGAGKQVGILADSDVHRDELLLVEGLGGDDAHPLTFFVELLRFEVFQVNHAGRRFAHFALAIELGSGQVAGDGRVASTDANQLADDGQRAPEDGDGENHLQK
jgi:hypothetical protein